MRNAAALAGLAAPEDIATRPPLAASYTIRSPFDCLIAACAIRHGVPVLHADRDFEHIARVTTLEQRFVAG